MSQQKGNPPSFWVHFVAGGSASTAAILCPLEVVKTRLQSSLYKPKQPASTSAFGHIKGVIDILVEIKRTEGVRALWKGLGPNLIGVAPARAIYFSIYSQSKHLFTSWNRGHDSPIVHSSAAALAGTCVTLCTNPIWLVKTRMQLQSENSSDLKSKKYKNALDCVYRVIKEEGIRGLYKGSTLKGFSASLLGISETTIQFVIYESLKKTYKKRNEKNNTPDTWVDTFSAASIAKLTAAIITYPHEVIRTRLRQSPQSDGTLKYKRLVQASKLILKEEGAIAFYGGMTAHLMRVVPNAAIMFLCYELFLKLIS